LVRLGITADLYSDSISSIEQRKGISPDFASGIMEAFLQPDGFDYSAFRRFDVPTLVDYLRRSHMSYRDKRLPETLQLVHHLMSTECITPVLMAVLHTFVRDYRSEGRLVYINDIQIDADGHPVILYVTATSFQPGPPGEPRFQTVARWDGRQWHFSEVTTTTHNYDVGSIYIEGDVWRVFAPAEPGPQRWGTGGEVAIWRSTNRGESWEKERDVTRNSERNHSYVRRPVNAHDDFHAFWADGDADKLSPSHLYFTNKAGSQVWRLPYDMEGETARPELVNP
jgi:hypothetical protein